MSESAYLDPALQATKRTFGWYSPRLEDETTVVRWGHFGTPILLYPTAGGDAEEVERFYLIKTLAPLLHAGRIKVYSVDSVAGRTWLTSEDVGHCVWVQRQYDEFLTHEVVPLIRTDCESEDIEIITAGASIGAFNALLSLCRHPEIFSAAICMSGTFALEKWLRGEWYDEFHHYSPLHFLPHMEDGEQLQQLRQRFVVIPTGQGLNEDPDESWKVAHTLGEKGIPNRVDLWDPKWEHDWVTWRAMLPQYVEELLDRDRLESDSE